MRQAFPDKELVLLGGGHAHAGVVKSLAMNPEPGVMVTLVSRDIHTPYSGMLPGLIAGHYTFDETHIDLNALARFAHARFIHDEAIGVDPQRQQVLFAGRPPVRYDVLSVNIGSSPSAAGVEGASQHAVGVKPISTFLRRWQALQDRVIASRDPMTIAIVGAGAAGVETILAMQLRLLALRQSLGCDAPLEFCLVSGPANILPAFPARVRTSFEKILEARKIRVFAGEPVLRVDNGVLHMASGSLCADEIVWITAAAPALWLRNSGLELDDKGFVLIGDDLRSLSHPNVFAAGDIASMANYPRPKAGVFAVRQTAPLAQNLRRALRGEALKSFAPQRQFLTLISTGGKHAVASRGGLSLGGAWAWRWKDHIDRKFMKKFNELPDMTEGGDGAIMRCAGCGAKVGGASLASALSQLKPLQRDTIISGFNAPDDAAIIDHGGSEYELQTVDFFPAPVTDPYVFGRIAANHALGDIFAMGGEPRTARAIASIPFAKSAIMAGTLEQMMSGAIEILNQAGAALVGGHSAEGEQLALGFALTGVVKKNALLTKSALAAGDMLILTKPLGTGVLLAADMHASSRGRWIEAAINSMLRSSAQAAQILREHGATGCSDVTGFGLAGHLLEMLKASQLDAIIELDRLPMLDGALDLLAAGYRSTAQDANETYAQPFVELSNVNSLRHAIVFDPQTAGGLLAGVPASAAEACINDLKRAGYDGARIIGSTLGRSAGQARIQML